MMNPPCDYPEGCPNQAVAAIKRSTRAEDPIKERPEVILRCFDHMIQELRVRVDVFGHIVLIESEHRTEGFTRVEEIPGERLTHEIIDRATANAPPSGFTKVEEEVAKIEGEG